MPSDLQEQMTLLDLNIPRKDWDKYTCADRAKIIAASVIKNRIELIRRIYDYLETNKRSALEKAKK